MFYVDNFEQSATSSHEHSVLVMRQLKQVLTKIIKEKSHAIEAHDCAKRKKCKLSERVIVSDNQLNDLCMQMDEKNKILSELISVENLNFKRIEELEHGVQQVKQQKEFLKNNECQVVKQ